MTILDVRIVPHRPVFCDATWFRLQIKTPLVEICRLRLSVWRTVGDYPSFTSAYGNAYDILAAARFNMRVGKFKTENDKEQSSEEN